MASLDDIAAYLQDYLKIDQIPDYSNALNGVQLANSGKVTKIVAAVDSHLQVIEKAIEADADLLLVHHGMFWLGAQPITGGLYRKLKLAMDHDLAIYSVHIPLDEHPDLGNNALLAKAVGLTNPQPLMPWKGSTLGLSFESAQPRDQLVDKVAKAVDGKVHCCPGGPETTKRIAVITGGGGGEISAVAELGIDTFITGEGPHWSYTVAEELGVNLIYGGHYATETFGVRALSEHLAEKYDVSWEFVDHPTGL